METARMCPSRMSVQIGATSSRSLKQTRATPRPFSIRAVPGTTEPITDSRAKRSWTLRSGAPPFSRSSRTWLGSMLSSSSNGSPKKGWRRTRAPVDLDRAVSVVNGRRQ
jgi:hypothetical protein